MSNIPKIPRYIVTGVEAGKSKIIHDGVVKNVIEDIPGLVIADVWATDTMPIDLNREVQLESTLFPKTPKNGSFFRYVCIPPDTELFQHLPAALQQNNPETPHPLMHKTATLDYIIILSGELYLIMDEGETLLKPGDIVIQRGTNHAWSNRSKEPCIQLAILLDASK